MALRGGRACRVALAGLLLAAPLTALGLREAYNAGVEAVEQGRWGVAAERLREAIAEREEPSRRLAKNFFRRYTPHYYLGLALIRGGDCEAGLQALDRSERHGVIREFQEDHATVRDLRRECAARRARLERDAAFERVREALAEAEAAAARVAGLRGRRELEDAWTSGNPSLGMRERELLEALRRAGSALGEASGEPSLDEIERVDAEVRRIWKGLEAVYVEATQRLAEIRADVAAERRALAELAGDARDLLERTSYIAPFPSRVRLRRGEVQRLLEAVEAESGGAVERVQELTGRLRSAIEALRVATLPPPRQLARAVDAFLEGDAQGVLTLLDGVVFSTGAANAQAHLLRAYAFWTEARLASTGGEELLAQARESVALGLEAEPGVRPHESYFPPPFVELVAGVVAEREAASD